MRSGVWCRLPLGRCMEMKIVYVGGSPSRAIVSCGITAERGVPIEVPDDIAVSLLRKPTWEKAKDSVEEEE